MTAQVLRFFPEYLALRTAMGKLGPVRAARFARRCAPPAWGGWLQNPAKSGGGAFDLLIHDIDMCLHLFGRPAGVAATGAADWVDGRLFYEGFTVTVEGGWVDSPAYEFSMEYRVITAGGTVEYDSAGRAPTLFAAKEETLPLVARD